MASAIAFKSSEPMMLSIPKGGVGCFFMVASLRRRSTPIPAGDETWSRSFSSFFLSTGLTE